MEQSGQTPRSEAPCLQIPYQGNLFMLPVQKLDVNVEFNVSTAFVKITGVWVNIAKYKSDCRFVIPLTGTVTSCNIMVNDKMLSTAVIPNAEAQRLQAENPKYDEKKDEDMNDDGAPAPLPEGKLPEVKYEEYEHGLFRLPIADVPSQGVVKVEVVYIEPLSFSDNKYRFNLPLTIQHDLLHPSKKVSEIVSIKCVINSVTPDVLWESETHKLKCMHNEFPRVELQVVDLDKNDSSAADGGDTSRESSDFSLAYSMSSQHVLPTFVTQVDNPEHEGTKNETGSFLLFVTPPSLENVSGYFKRDVVFLLDRSGSMNGEPYIEATRALVYALKQLRPQDRFAIINFDHRQAQFRPSMSQASESNIEAATDWVRTLQPQRGGTDIQTPFEQALVVLDKDQASRGDPLLLPTIVVITDGCVKNEREICKFANDNCQRVRVLSFGIGSYCNWFFLKMLAQIGRGFSDVVVYKEKIFQQIVQLMEMAAVPVITDVTLGMDGLVDVELYPFPLPDLFMGAPLTISGRYKGKMPETVYLRGVLADSSPYEQPMKPRHSEVIPVDKVFLKQRMDLLSARAWLEDSAKVQNEVVDLSCNNSMPSAYTTMVAYETTPDEKEALDEKRALALQGKTKKKWYRNPKTIAALAVGNVAIGAVAFSFGDLGASIGNVPVIGDFAEGLGVGGDGGCCGGDGCCGDCECDDCGDCLAC